MGTSQSTIPRLESGQTLPGIKTLLRYAEATGSKFMSGYRRPDAALARQLATNSARDSTESVFGVERRAISLTSATELMRGRSSRGRPLNKF
jgi:transcriptional regulator with XRE-family HTH domain